MAEPLGVQKLTPEQLEATNQSIRTKNANPPLHQGKVQLWPEDVKDELVTLFRHYFRTLGPTDTAHRIHMDTGYKITPNTVSRRAKQWGVIHAGKRISRSPSPFGGNRASTRV